MNNSKLAGWKGAILSQASKVTLLKATLQNLPIYALSLFKTPRNFAEAIERIQKKFLFSGVEDKNRIPLISWNKICTPKVSRGLGLRNIISMNNAL